MNKKDEDSLDETQAGDSNCGYIASDKEVPIVVGPHYVQREEGCAPKGGRLRVFGASKDNQ
jgi:hypothetical protein